MEFRVQTLSPVHIGSGRNVEPFEYVVDGGQYFRVDMDAFMERAYDQDPEAPERLSAWITKTSEQIENLDQRRNAGRLGGRDYNQRLSALRREFNLLAFCRSYPEYRGLADLLLAGDGLSHYRCWTNASERYVLKEQVKTADFQPFIPGSSIKGAIRTALAHLVLTEMREDEKRHIRDGLSAFLRRADNTRNRREKTKLKEDAATDVEKFIFMCGVRGDRAISYSDVHYDLMKVVSISDTYNPDARFLVPQIHTFVKKRTRDGQSLLDAQAPILLEAVDVNRHFSVRIEVDTAFLKRAARMTCEQDWIDLPKKFKRLFGFALSDVERMSKEEIEGKIVDRVRAACQKHSIAVADEERRWMEKFPGEVDHPNEFYQKFQKMPEGITPLRLGWGSHFMTTTLLLAFRNDEVLGPTLEQLIRVFELDLTRQQRERIPNVRTRRINVEEFPRSRRLVSVNRKPFAPLGWIALRLPGAPPVEPLVRMEDLIAKQRTEPATRRSPSGRSDRPSGTGRRGQRPRTRFEAPPRRAEPLPAVPKSLPKPEPKAQGRPKIREGQQVSAEVLSYKGGVVRVRLTGAAGEELEFRAFRAFGIGEKIKVKVESVNNAGRVTKVRI